MSGSDPRTWPAAERRTRADRRRGRDRRSGPDRRSEAGWQPVPLEDEQIEDPALFDAACLARARAQAPYSGFAVGAALRTADGAIVTGCNIENASYSLTVCAERVALLKALSDGHMEFTRILVVADTESPTPPCGPCRQLLWEYCGDIEIVLADLAGPRVRHQLAALLPLPFDYRLLR